MYIIKEKITNQSLIFLKLVDENGEELRIRFAREFASPLEKELDTGDRIDDGGLLELTEKVKLTFAVTKALDLLSYGGQSRHALVTKLRTKYKIEKEYANGAADYAVAHGYIDEVSQALREAEVAIRSKGRGKRRIAADLAAKGYSRESVWQALDSIGDEVYYGALMTLVRKKFDAPPYDANEYRKIASSIVRLGHSYSDINRAYAELYGEENDTEE